MAALGQPDSAPDAKGNAPHRASLALATLLASRDARLRCALLRAAPCHGGPVHASCGERPAFLSCRHASAGAMQVIAHSRGLQARELLNKSGALALAVALAQHGNASDARVAAPLLAVLMIDAATQAAFMTRHDGAALLLKLLSIKGTDEAAVGTRQPLAAAAGLIGA